MPGRNLKDVNGLNRGTMTEQEITELAAILIYEHGHAALSVAQCRRNQHARDPRSAAYRLWTWIAEVTAKRLRARRRKGPARTDRRRMRQAVAGHR